MSFIAAINRVVLLGLLSLLLAGCNQIAESNSDELKDPHFLDGKRRATSFDYPGAVGSFEKALEANPRSASALRLHVRSPPSCAEGWSQQCFGHGETVMECIVEEKLQAVERKAVGSAQRRYGCCAKVPAAAFIAPAARREGLSS